MDQGSRRPSSIRVLGLGKQRGSAHAEGGCRWMGGAGLRRGVIKSGVGHVYHRLANTAGEDITTQHLKDCYIIASILKGKRAT
jgi:hypothetical protein